MCPSSTLWGGLGLCVPFCHPDSTFARWPQLWHFLSVLLLTRPYTCTWYPIQLCLDPSVFVRKSLHLLGLGEEKTCPIVRFKYLCHVISEDSVFVVFLYVIRQSQTSLNVVNQSWQSSQTVFVCRHGLSHLQQKSTSDQQHIVTTCQIFFKFLPQERKIKERNFWMTPEETKISSVCCYVLLNRYWGIVTVPELPQGRAKEYIPTAHRASSKATRLFLTK